MSLHSDGSSDTHGQPGTTAPAAASPSEESRKERALRHGHRAALYAAAVLFIGVVVILIVLIAANLRTVELDWVFGSTHASLVWVILAATVLGWLLGVATSVLFRYRTRAPR